MRWDTTGACWPGLHLVVVLALDLGRVAAAAGPLAPAGQACTWSSCWRSISAVWPPLQARWRSCWPGLRLVVVLALDLGRVAAAAGPLAPAGQACTWSSCWRLISAVWPPLQARWRSCWPGRLRLVVVLALDLGRVAAAAGPLAPAGRACAWSSCWRLISAVWPPLQARWRSCWPGLRLVVVLALDLGRVPPLQARWRLLARPAPGRRAGA
jgi:hypothetical protein